MTRGRTSALLAMAMAASLSAATAVAVPPPPSSSFSGSTNQTKAPQHDVTLDTDANGHVSVMNIDWRAKCKKKGIFWTAKTRINGGSAGFKQNGDAFGQGGTYTSKAGGGVKGTVTATAKGSFVDADHATGTWTAKVVVRKKGKKIDKCQTGTVKWTVARPPAG
jgi:hypothetical protein